MKRILAGFLMAWALVAVLTLPVGCGSTDTDDNAAQPEIEVKPVVGMTRDEIKTMYQGEPDSKTVSSDGTETWSYHMNAGEAWIPYNFGYRPEYHTLRFDKDGKLISFETTE